MGRGLARTCCGLKSKRRHSETIGQQTRCPRLACRQPGRASYEKPQFSETTQAAPTRERRADFRGPAEALHRNHPTTPKMHCLSLRPFDISPVRSSGFAVLGANSASIIRDMSNIPDQRLLGPLLDSWDRNNAILLNLLHALPEGGLEARAMEGSPSIAQLFTHIHYVRLVFFFQAAPVF